MAVWLTILISPKSNKFFDPYDPWMSEVGVKLKRSFYSGTLRGKSGAIILGLSDWAMPQALRAILCSCARAYPIVDAIICKTKYLNGDVDCDSATTLLESLKMTSTDPSGANGWSWGLGFPWMSKNGLYGPELPFITHTPYVMEALLDLEATECVRESAACMFHSTWDFLQSLQVMHDSNNQLALSYAPVDEPRIVVNANSYAAFAYALHMTKGRSDIGLVAEERLSRLIAWVINQQRDDGSWYYYADDDPGNFIDCFHSCFVIKNLIKVRSLQPKPLKDIDISIDRGWKFISDHFFDHKSGLCRRFVERDIKDPFRWDLYDQAEYLGLLIDFGLLDEAKRFSAHVEQKFRKGNNWYCRIDIFGRRWGKNFMRWGIVPFQYHRARLDVELAKTESSCVA